MHTASCRTWVPSANDKVETKWYLVDAEGLVLGRLASEISRRLRGKHKAFYTPHADVGDHVVVVNAEKLALTGKKMSQKVYYRHTGYPGGVKESRVDEVLGGAHSERVLKMAVRRMMSRGSLGRSQMRKLHVYSGEAHPHGGQKLERWDFGSVNEKNRVRSR